MFQTYEQHQAQVAEAEKDSEKEHYEHMMRIEKYG
jgi:hypothetical protein